MLGKKLGKKKKKNIFLFTLWLFEPGVRSRLPIFFFWSAFIPETRGLPSPSFSAGSLVRPRLGPLRLAGASRRSFLFRLGGGKRVLSVKGRFGALSATVCTPRMTDLQLRLCFSAP